MKSIIKTSLCVVCLSIFVLFTYAENESIPIDEVMTNQTEKVCSRTKSSTKDPTSGQNKTNMNEEDNSSQRRAKGFGWGLLVGMIVTVILCITRPDRILIKYCKKIITRKDMIPMSEEYESKEGDGGGQDGTGGGSGGGEPIPVTPKYEASFAVDNSDWAVVGTSVIGNSHVSMDIPCQDNCKYEYLGDGWGIAVTSDGAGSAKHSHVGSKIVTSRAIEYLKKVIEKEGWKAKNILPSDAIWTQYAYNVLHYVYEDLVNFGKAQGVDYKDLSATVIVLIHTPNGVLSAHIGDGRCGYKDMNGNWKSIITPHKGEEANQTIFITSDFWSIHNYVMSDVAVPECIVVREPITAFVLMSDGCEHTAWLCNQYDESKQWYYDPNTPYAKLLDNCCETIITDHEENTPMDERAAKWENFIVAGNKKIEVESDDKTLLLGVLCKQKISDDCIYPQTRID